MNDNWLDDPVEVEAADADYVPDEPPRTKQRRARASTSQVQVNQPGHSSQPMTSSQSLPTPQEPSSTSSAPVLMTQLLIIMEELKSSFLDQSKLIEKQQAQIDSHIKLFETQQAHIDAQSKRIQELEKELQNKNSVVQGEIEEEEKDEEEKEEEAEDDNNDDNPSDDNNDDGGAAQQQPNNAEFEAGDEQPEFSNEEQQPEPTSENNLQMVVYTGPSDETLNMEEGF